MPKEEHFNFVTRQNARAGFIYGCFVGGRSWSSELLKRHAKGHTAGVILIVVFSQNKNRSLWTMLTHITLRLYAYFELLYAILQKLYGYCLISS